MEHHGLYTLNNNQVCAKVLDTKSEKRCQHVQADGIGLLVSLQESEYRAWLSLTPNIVTMGSCVSIDLKETETYSPHWETVLPKYL